MPEKRDVNAFDVLKHLEVEIKAGRIVAFAAIGIAADDQTRMWSFGPTKSRLQMRGAIDELKDAYLEATQKPHA